MQKIWLSLFFVSPLLFPKLSPPFACCFGLSLFCGFFCSLVFISIFRLLLLHRNPVCLILRLCLFPVVAMTISLPFLSLLFQQQIAQEFKSYLVVSQQSFVEKNNCLHHLDIQLFAAKKNVSRELDSLQHFSEILEHPEVEFFSNFPRKGYGRIIICAREKMLLHQELFAVASKKEQTVLLLRDSIAKAVLIDFKKLQKLQHFDFSSRYLISLIWMCCNFFFGFFFLIPVFLITVSFDADFFALLLYSTI